MAIRLNYNPMSVQTHANLSRTDRMMEQVLNKLSSGSRIQRTADDPAGAVVANAVRFYRKGVDRAQANAEEAVTMLQTAEGSMDQITQVLQRIRSLAIAANSTATQDTSQLSALQSDLDAAIRSITTIADQASYGGISLLDGSLRDNALPETTRAHVTALTSDATLLPGGIRDGSDFTIHPVSAPLDRSRGISSYGAGTPGSTPVDAFVFGSETLTVTGPLGSAVVSVSSSTTLDGLVVAVNAASKLTGVAAAYDEVTGDLTFESTSFGATPISITPGATLSFPPPAITSGTDQTLVVDFIDAAGSFQSVTLVQDPTSPGGRTFTNPNGGPPEGGPPPYVGFAPGAFHLTLKDTSGGAIGSTLAPALQDLTATRTGSTAFQIGALASQRVTVEIPDMRAGALGHSAGLAGTVSIVDPTHGFASLADLLAQGAPPAYQGALVSGDADAALRVIDAALAEVNQARGSAGSLQGNTIERVLESLQVSSQNLQGFESILRDVDMAAESAEFARVQVMIQAATAMLAQANQVPQTVLQLLK